MKLSHLLLSALGTLCLLIATPTHAADWPGFRGPNRDGKSAETGLLNPWPEGGPPRLATIAGLGRGYSSASVVQGRIYITGAAGQNESAFCFDTSGKKLWEKVISATAQPNASPRSTPTVDAGKVYVRNLDGAVVCLDATSGEILWTIDVLKEFHGTLSPESWTHYQWTHKQISDVFGGEDWPGFGDTPVTESVLVEGDKLICTPGGPDACIVALDKTTGRTLWTSKGLSDAPSVCSPITFDFAGVRQIATVTAKAVVGLRAADGQLLWRCEVHTPVASLLYNNGIVFVGGPAGAIQLTAPAAAGENIHAAPLYSIQGNHGWAQGGYDASNLLIMGAVLSDGYIYASSSDYDRARTCVELATGKTQHHVTEASSCGRATGPILFADGLLYYQSEFGAMRLVECTPKSSKALSTFWFPYLNGRTTAYPAISDHKLFIRNQDRLFIYDLAAGQTVAATAPAPPPATTTPAPASPGVWTADWPQFRGPHRDGKSPETGLLKTWPKEGPPLLLTIDAGTGPSSPAIVGDRIYIGGSVHNKGFIFCFDLSGKKLWETPIGGVASMAGNLGPASSPTIDGDTLYFETDGGTILALDTRDGHELWKVDATKIFGGRYASWGHTESVLIDGDNLICTPGGLDACMVALNKKTGATVWQTHGLSDPAANGSPIAFDFAGQHLLATITARSLVCVAAKDGRFLWRYDRPSTWYPPHAGWPEANGGHNVSTPFYADGMLGGFNIHTSGGAVRLTPGEAGGDVTAEQAWDSHAFWPKASGYIPVDGYLYGCSVPGNGSAFVCVQLATGKTMFYTPDNDVGGPFLFADGRFYCTGFRSGPNLSLIEQTPTGFHKTGHLTVMRECVSYPALSGGRLYVRPFDSKLLVYDVRDRRAALARCLHQKYAVTLDGPALLEKLTMPDAALAEKLLAALQDNDATVRAGAIDVIANVQPDNHDAITVLTPGLANAKIQTPLAEAFVKLDPKRPEIVAPLAAQLASDTPTVQHAAMDHLATIGPVNPAARAVLTEKLKSSALRANIIVALLKHDLQHPALPGALRELLAGSDTEGKLAALSTADEYHCADIDLLKILQAGLQDSNAEVRGKAAAALLSTRTRNKDSMLALAHTYATDKDENVRKIISDLLPTRWDRRPTLELAVARMAEKELVLSANTYLDAANATDASHWHIDGVPVVSVKLLQQNRAVVLTTQDPLPWDKDITIVPQGVTTPEGLAPLPMAPCKLLPGIPANGDVLWECLAGEPRTGIKITDALAAGVLDEKALHPRVGETWHVVTKAWNSLDLTKSVNAPRDAVIHAHVYVYCTTDRNVQLWLGSTDGLRVCVNGSPVHVSTVLRALSPDQDKIDKVALKKGWNSVLVMLCRNGATSEVSLRIMDEHGQKPTGISYSATEPEQIAPTAH